jgi:iron complex transport system substrate-binding protein
MTRRRLSQYALRTRTLRFVLLATPLALLSAIGPSPCLLAAISGGAHEVIDETGRKVVVPEHPQRIISLAPSITETLYALGQDHKIAGDTEYCDYPPAAASKPHIGAVLNPSIEKIVALKPDLVIGAAEANRRETADQLARVGIPVYGLTDKSLDDVLKSIRDLGGLLDCQAQASALASSLELRVQAVERRVAGLPRPRVLFVTWYQPLITVGPGSFVADVIRRAGGVSISNDLAGEWPRVSLEAVLERNPEIILLPKSQAYTPSLEDLKNLAGWRDLSAVKAGHVYQIADTIIRPCPRLVGSLEEVAGILHPDQEEKLTDGGRMAKGESRVAIGESEMHPQQHSSSSRHSLLAIGLLDYRGESPR